MSSEANSVVSVTPDTKKPRKFPWRGIGMFFSTFAIVILILAMGYGSARILQANRFLVHAFNKMEQQLQQQQNQMSILQAQVNNTQTTNTQLQTELAAQTQTINDWRNKQQNPQTSWTVLEAQYLAKIANDNLMFNHNIPAAVAALKSADELLQKLQDPNVEPIRRALITDMDTLQSAALVDTTGLYLRLSVLNQKIDSLPLHYEQSQPVSTEEQSVQPDQKWWQKGLHNIWLSLSQLVQVRYNPPNTAPFILPEQKNYLYQNLHAQIQNAQWGLLTSNDAVYKAGLAQTEIWVKQYFNLEANETQYILSQLAELEKINLQPSVTSLTGSLQAFHNYFAQPQGNKTTGAAS